MVKGLRSRTTFITYIFTIILVTGCFFYFWYVVPYHIGFKEQMQIFVFSSSYILSYFSKPAVLACLGGDFLTQFLYFKAGGAAIVTLLLATEWWLTFLTLKRFSFKSQPTTFSEETLCVVAFLPVIIEWISIPNHLFSLDLSISFIIALSTFLIYAKTSGKVSIITGILLIPTLYIIAGASVFLFFILVILYDIYGGRSRYIYWAVFSGVAISLPLLIRYLYLLTPSQAYLYPFSTIMQELSLVTAAIVVLLFVCFRNVKLKIPQPIITLIVLISLLITGLVKTMDKNQENLFGIFIEAYHKNWDLVLSIAQKTEYNPIATSYTNIALSQQSLLGDQLMDFYKPYTNGVKRLSSIYNVIEMIASNDVFFHIGDMDMAHRAAKVSMIFTPRKRSARLIERLVEINLSINDIPTANKYIRMLESTLFHKIKTENGNPSVQQREPVIYRENILRKENNISESLVLLVESNTANLPAVNFLLCSYLINRNIFSFFEAYTSYYKEKTNRVPKVYAEALMIYFTETGTMDKATEYGIPPEITQSFNEYNQLYEQSLENLTFMLQKYPDSYWPYYQSTARRRAN